MRTQELERFGQSDVKILSVLVGGKEFGIKINQSKEVIGMTHIDEIPKMPDFMLGFCNLRGSIIPVIDLRKKLGLQATPATTESCIVILDIQGQRTGALVDSLNGVVTICKDDFQEQSEDDDSILYHFISGVGNNQGQMIFILNIEKVLSNEKQLDLQEH